LGSNHNTRNLLRNPRSSQQQLSSSKQIKHIMTSPVSRTAEQHSNNVAALHEQLQAAVDRVKALEADLANTRVATAYKMLAGRCGQQQKGSLDGEQGIADDQQQEVVQQGIRQAAPAAKSVGEEPAVQVAGPIEQLQQDQPNVAALEAELAAALQQAGQACGSAVFARQQVTTLSAQLQEAVGKIVQLESEAAVAKQQAVQAANELQALREAAASAAAERTASMVSAEIETQRRNESVERERVLLQQQLEQERSNGLQLKAQLAAAKDKVSTCGCVCTRIGGRTRRLTSS
jgi:hypothetical protein